MFEGWCLVCAESYDLPVILPNGLCSFCQGPPRDCDCLDICRECGEELQIMDVGSQSI